LIEFDWLVLSVRQRLATLLGALAVLFKTSAQLRLENLALRQQLTVLRRSTPKRLQLTPADRIFWVWLRCVWTDWKSALLIVKPETVIAWQRKGFRLFWTGKIRRGQSTGSAEYCARRTGSDSHDESKQSALGRPADPRRVAQAGD
jgi:hypothetical protein